MWVTEHASKLLLEEVGVGVPPGAGCSCDEAPRVASRLGFPLYVKALIPAKERAASGGVRLVRTAAELREALDLCASLGSDSVRLEVEIKGTAAWYVAIGWFPPDERPHILFSPEGGSGIEARAATIRRVCVDPEIGPLPYHVRGLTRGTRIDRETQDQLLALLRACYQLLWAKDAVLVELNPVALCRPRPIVLDARIIVDGSSRIPKTDPRLAELGSSGPCGIPDDLAERGIVYVPLGGTVGVAGLGAGMTMHLADWVGLEGAPPAFFFDATEAAVRDWRAMFAGELPEEFAGALGYGLSRVLPTAQSLLVNFTSGGTPVDALVRAFLHAWDKGLGWDGPCVVHAAGNSGEAARRLLADAGLDVPETLGDTVRRAVQLAAAELGPVSG